MAGRLQRQEHAAVGVGVEVWGWDPFCPLGSPEQARPAVVLCLLIQIAYSSLDHLLSSWSRGELPRELTCKPFCVTHLMLSWQQ